MRAMARLDVLSGVKGKKSFPLWDAVEIGRNQANTICLPDHQVSRHHARITRQGDVFVIEDLQSSNGVMLQGKRLPAGVPCELHDGDEVGIGSAVFVFRLDEEALPSAPVPQHTAPAAQPQSMTEGAHLWSLQKDFGTLTVTPLQEEATQPSVALMLDVSDNLAALDIHETQMHQGMREALQRLRAMCQVSMALGTITDRTLLLERIVGCIFEIFPAADRLCVLMRERGSEALVPVVARKRHEEAGRREEMPVSHAIIQEVITHKRAVLSFDALGDKRFERHASVINLSIRSMMCAPLLVGDELLGVMQVDSRSGPNLFLSEDLQILTGLSAQVAITVKNMQLYEAVQIETARRTSLQRYFSPGLVELLMSGNLSTTLGGSAYHGTILFSDIIGFTALSEALAPTDIVTRLNRYFSIMQRVIYERGGNVDKLNGDSIMAFWGVPYRKSDDERQAVLTALRMQQHLWVLNQALAAEHQLPIHMGIGINSGEFVAGNIGSEDKIEFTLIGDTVNLAARIEELAGRYQILIAETTWQSLRKELCAVRLPPVYVKGKSCPVTVYSVRALLEPSQSEAVMALPCDICDAHGQQAIAVGMLIRQQRVGTRTQLHVHTDRPVERGTTYTLRLRLVEHHERLTMSARVESVTPSAEGIASPGMIAVLTVVAEQAAVDLLTPGNCLVTAYQWDQLERH
jgi:class 3 adenylate cyclase